MAAKLRLGGAKGILPDEVVWDILTWLPTKSLMRFKAVSKVWLSIILDPKFAREHRSPFRGLLLMNHDPSSSLGWRQPTRDFFIANLDDALGGESSNDAKDVNVSFQFSIPEDIGSFHATNMVNGLICFYHRNVAKLCNIATREMINLPNSRCDYKYCTYHLGFEPIQSVYKLLKICPIYDLDEVEDCPDFFPEDCFMDGDFNIISIECEILTLGVDSSWRSIDPPPNSIIPHGLCVDGVLYWMTVVPGLETSSYPLFSFNLAREKFQSICKPLDWDGNNQQLLDFGSAALVQKDDDDKIMITHFVEGCWTEMKKYSLDLGREDVQGLLPNDDLLIYSEDIQGLFPNGDLLDIRGLLSNGDWLMYSEDVRGLLPNGDLLIYSGEGVGDRSQIFLFDENKNDLQKFILRFPPSDIELSGRILWYEENISSLKSLTGF